MKCFTLLIKEIPKFILHLLENSHAFWLVFIGILTFFSLQDLGEFIKTADAGLTKPVEEGDFNGLVECMGHLMAVKDRSATTDAMFEPLKQSIELLKAYDQELSEDTHTLLQVGISWLEIIRKNHCDGDVFEYSSRL